MFIVNNEETVIDFIDTDCPACGALDGEPCARNCEDDYLALVGRGRKHNWDDGEKW